MRQWLEAGYFKGDLPISQMSSGPFHQLSNWFPDLSTAFTAKAAGQQGDPNSAALKEHQRNEAEAAANAERQRLAQEEEAKKAKAAAMAEAAAQKEAEEAAVRARELELKKAAAEPPAPISGGNQSSNQLKMMLGLSSGVQPPVAEQKAPDVADVAKPAKKASAKATKSTGKKASQKTADKSQGGSQPEQKAEAPVPEPVPAPAPAPPPAPAWGGIANNKPRKSMSEIQQEEARAAAELAAKRGNMPQPSSGWANVAAGTNSWSSGAIRTSAVQNVAPVTSVRPGQAPSKAQPKKVASNTQHARAAPVSSSTPAEEFGASMSPALERWCKEKMQQINGSTDLTLVAFCMTLNDASEIRQYLTTYLGSTSQVNNFATEFINKRGLGSKQEEWETPGSAKKGRKKKSGR